MLYYRYRPASELTIKELLYDEIYFSSTSECNDPYDSKPFYSFGKDCDKWARLLESACSHIKNLNYHIWVKPLAKMLTEDSPLTFDDVLKYNFTSALSKIPNPPSIIESMILDTTIKRYVNLYKPEQHYFAAFSKTCSNHLMWAHYASMYQGYCLIFKDIDGKLNQSNLYRNTSIRRKTKNGIAPSMSNEFPESFLFEDIIYIKDTSLDDAFLKFPPYVSGYNSDEADRIELATLQHKRYLEKHVSWSYEEEVRIHISSPMPWLFGEHINLTKQERLIHFKPSQLVGIILGPQMKSEFKERILEIIQRRMERLGDVPPNTKTEIFDFVIFEATLSNTSRDINIDPVQILSLTNSISKQDKDFYKMYKEWEDGWALVFGDNGHCSKKQIT